MAELDYMIPKNEAATPDQLETLHEAGILDVYVHEPTVSTRDLPSKFWGPTERRVEILYEHNFLRDPQSHGRSMKRRRNPSGCTATRTQRDRDFPER